MNYMNFAQDNHGELYLYGRIFVQGIQSWGLYRYDTSTRRWLPTVSGGMCSYVSGSFRMAEA